MKKESALNRLEISHQVAPKDNRKEGKPRPSILPMNAFFYKGEDLDPDAEKLGIQKHHLAGAVFSLLSILHTMDTRPELDDRVNVMVRRFEEKQKIRKIK